MKPFRIFILTTCLLSVCNSFSHAQGDEQGFRDGVFLQKRMVVPPSPDAASLGKYGDANVNMYTGALGLNIPIYAIPAKDIPLNISLSYDGSGNKVSELPSWVGLGWTLASGGVITRSIQGNPDLKNNYFDKAAIITNLFPPTDKIQDNDEMYDVAEAKIETQPDNFYFNFAGMSGKFYISPTKTIIQKEVSDLTIIPNFNTTNDDILTFSVKDAQGNVYDFAAVEQTFYQLDDDYGAIPPQYTSYTFNSSWYLTKITAANGTETLDFTYTVLFPQSATNKK